VWWRVRVAAVTFVVATMLALTTALLGLLVEDSLPLTGRPHITGGRCAALGVALLLLFLAILWRGSVHRRTGTLFYVRLIDAGWADWHTIPVQIASQRRMSLRSVTRWVDLSSHTRDGVIDVVDVCAEVAGGLESVVNGDRDDTAYTVAPNMPWPAALAVGAELPIVDGLQLLELPGRPDSAGDDTAEESFRLPQPSADVGTPPRPLSRSHTGTRVGLLLTFTGRGLDPDTAFEGMDVGDYYGLDPASMGVDLARRVGANFTGAELAKLAAALPPAVAEIKRAAGDRELVVAAAMPKTLAMALGWALAQGTCRFFTGTHLLHQDGRSGRYLPMRVNRAQPASLGTGPA
jgi:hypothetical protein